jgi:hypothetical protein
MGGGRREREKRPLYYGVYIYIDDGNTMWLLVGFAGGFSYPIHIEIKGRREKKETAATTASSSYSRCTRQRLSLNPQYIECARLISKCFLMTGRAAAAVAAAHI